MRCDAGQRKKREKKYAHVSPRAYGSPEAFGPWGPRWPPISRFLLMIFFCESQIVHEIQFNQMSIHEFWPRFVCIIEQSQCGIKNIEHVKRNNHQKHFILVNLGLREHSNRIQHIEKTLHAKYELRSCQEPRVMRILRNKIIYNDIKSFTNRICI